MVNFELWKKYAGKVEYFKISSLDEELKYIYRDLTNYILVIPLNDA